MTAFAFPNLEGGAVGVENSFPGQKIIHMPLGYRLRVSAGFGLLGLPPLLGVPFALAGMWASFSARRQEKYFWNPARPHRIIGLICAAMGALVWSAVDTILVYNAVNS